MSSKNGNSNDEKCKRMRPTKVDLPAVMSAARVIWRRENKQGSYQTEDLKFREYFGCGADVALTVWSMLETNDLLPPGGTIEKLLWALNLMKVYNNGAVANTCGGIDKKTLDKWSWGNDQQHGFIEAVAMLENLVVCCFAHHHCLTL